VSPRHVQRSDNAAAGGLVALAGNGGVLSAEAVNVNVRDGAWWVLMTGGACCCEWRAMLL
jgi:hypothetical protein